MRQRVIFRTFGPKNSVLFSAVEKVKSVEGLGDVVESVALVMFLDSIQLVKLFPSPELLVVPLNLSSTGSGPAKMIPMKITNPMTYSSQTTNNH